MSLKMVKMTILLFLDWFLIITNSCRVDARILPRTEELDERHLKLINKPPIRSIQTKFGDIIDCVDINKQPAFNHPLLKNHKLQRKPSFLDKRETTNERVLPTTYLEFELEKDSCPIGSVPILRTTKDDLIGKKSSNLTYMVAKDGPGTHFATLYTKKGNNRYLGVHGHASVYNPRVKKHQMSLAQIAVQSGGFGRINTILFGWQVSPQLYHDRRYTHLFALWTSDSFKTTGCYNMRCPGFIQIDRKIFLGIRVNHISSYGGPQFDLSFTISQDPNSKNWWLIVQNTKVGYFPGELFSNMSEADLVGWGGRVSGLVKGTSPQMGSGHFPDGDFKHACVIRKISYNNVTGSHVEPHEDDLLNIYVDSPHCYDLKYLGCLDAYNRYTLQFGGPGGKCSM